MIELLLATSIFVGVSVEQVDIDWIGDSTFAPQLVTVDATVWTKYLGIQARYGMSNSVESFKGDYKGSKAKLESFSSINLLARYPITAEYSIYAGVGYMDYNQSVTNFNDVDYGNYGDGYSNPDSGFMQTIGVMLTYDSYSVQLGYNLYHEKTKWKELERDGTESTQGIQLSFSYQIF